MKVSEIRAELERLQDIQYREMQIRIIPTVKPEQIIGVRTPELRRFARELLKRGGVSPFLEDLPHRYFDEDQLHAFIVSQEKEFDKCVSEVEAFTKEYALLVSLRRQLEQYSLSESERLRKLDMSTFAVQEINEAKLKKT